MQTEATGFNFIMTKSHHFVDEIVRNEHQMMVRMLACLAKRGQQKLGIVYGFLIERKVFIEKIFEQNPNTFCVQWP